MERFPKMKRNHLMFPLPFGRIKRVLKTGEREVPFKNLMDNNDNNNNKSSRNHPIRSNQNHPISHCGVNHHNQSFIKELWSFPVNKDLKREEDDDNDDERDEQLYPIVVVEHDQRKSTQFI
eukprot:scaffold6312_cov85-Cylindrotheca_fusiformis.AAC.3